MFIRALFAFLALPGVVGLLLPPVLATDDPWRGSGHAWGWALWSLGLLILLRCVRDFYVAGKGTLAPWSPPRELVTIGLYRYSRNPMYIGVITLIGGWSWIFTSPVVAVYATALACGFHARVVMHEEPWLRRQFPDTWPRYQERVPRWWPRWQRPLAAKHDAP